VKNQALVETLVNAARPCMRQGCEVRLTGCGEATVRQPQLRRYALISQAGVQVVELLDGSNTLNDIAGELLRRNGRVRHQVILDTLVRVHAAGLLEPISPELDRYLLRQARAARPGRLVRFARRLANLETHLPIPWRANRSRPQEENKDRQIFALAVLALSVILVLASGFFLWRHVVAGSAFGVDVLGGMLFMALGVCGAASWRALCRGLLLRWLGRDVLGWGIRISVGIVHLSVDARDERMLTRQERIRYRGKTLFAVALVGFGLLVASLISPATFWWPLALGWQIVLFVQLSPLWPGDGTRLLEEVLSHRHLGRVTRVYVTRKLWRHLWRLKRPEGEDLGLLVFACATLAFAFLSALALGLLLPGTIDGLTAALLEPGRTLGERLLAGAICGYLACALLLTLLALLGVVVGAVAQLLAGQRGRATPSAVVPASTLDLAELGKELRAIPPFSDMPESLVLSALQEGHLEHYVRGATILQQGAVGETCYVIRGGRCEVHVEDLAGRVVETAVLGPGHLFGEVALLKDVPRTATVRALDNLEVIALSRETFLAMVDRSEVPRDEITQVLRIHIFLKQVELLRGVGAEGMRTLLKAVRVHRPETGDVVVRQGQEGYSMFLIYQGKFKVSAGSHTVATLGPGQYFGEIALVTGAVRTATVTCLEAGVVVEVPARTYQQVIVREFASGVLLDKEVDARLEELDLNL
jgi:CRP-like cAMP-binding protein